MDGSGMIAYKDEPRFSRKESDHGDFYVRGLPESIARALEAMVNTLRQQFQIKKQHKQLLKLPVWEGKPLGKLTREEIYDDVT
jgi:hypothetical protein